MPVIEIKKTGTGVSLRGCGNHEISLEHFKFEMPLGCLSGQIGSDLVKQNTKESRREVYSKNKCTWTHLPCFSPGIARGSATADDTFSGGGILPVRKWPKFCDILAILDTALHLHSTAININAFGKLDKL